MVADKNLTKEVDSKKSENSKRVLSYPSKGEQTVLSIFGIELTAPEGLRNPGIVYLSFIVVNLIIFLLLRSFVNR